MTTTIESTRRRFMEMVAGGAVAIGAATGVTAANDDDETDDESNGLLVIIYDDSFSTDYTKAFPIHQEYGVPGCIAACPGMMEDHSEFMLPGQLEQMHENGWEVMSHTIHHRNLGAVLVTQDVDPDDRRIYAQIDNPGRTVMSFAGDTIIIENSDTSVEGVIADRGEDDDGRYVDLEEPVGESFDADDLVWLRYPEEFVQEILEGSRDMLESWTGSPVTSYIHTFDRTEFVEDFVPDYYATAGNGAGRGSGLNPDWEPDPYGLHREYFETNYMSDEELGEFLDQIANEPDFGILAGHTALDTLPAERIEKTIEMALERDIEIVTLQEALVRLDALDEDVLGDDNGDDNGDGNGDDNGDGNGDDNGDGDGDDNGDDDQGSVGGNGDDDGPGGNGDDEGSWVSRIIDRIMAALRSLFS